MKPLERLATLERHRGKPTAHLILEFVLSVLYLGMLVAVLALGYAHSRLPGHPWAVRAIDSLRSETELADSLLWDGLGLHDLRLDYLESFVDSLYDTP